MRITLALALLATTACTDTTATDEVAAESRGHGDPDVSFYEIFPPDQMIESVLINKKKCGIVFEGVSSPDADVLAIWHVGVGALRRDLPYPTDERPNFYAIFTPSDPTLNHTVAGQEQLDHYHVAERRAVDTADDLVDPWIVNPGPNYDAATYQVARSVHEMWKQVEQGILAQPITTIDAGLGPVVFHGQISCGSALEDIWNDGNGY